MMDKVKFIMLCDESNKLINSYNERKKDFRFAIGKKYFDDGTYILLNGVLYDIKNDIIYFSGNFDIYYTLDNDIVNAIKDFLTDDNLNDIWIKNLYFYKDNKASVSAYF